MEDIEHLKALCEGKLPDLLGIVLAEVKPFAVNAHLEVAEAHLAPNGFLHAGAIVSLADTACGVGCMASLPEAATGFTTIELKSNHLATVREGVIDCVAEAVHQGRTTQVWDAEVRCRASHKVLALFRCTQMVMYSPPA
ncbi:MAG: PaaI family thioesterase [Pseudomonadota bacterium]